MLHAIESLFFDGGDQLTVTHKRRSRIAVISVYPEYVHGLMRFDWSVFHCQRTIGSFSFGSS